MTLYCIFILLLRGTDQVQTMSTNQDIVQDQAVLTASVGDNATFQCFYKNPEAVYVAWYRQKLGGQPYPVSTGYAFSTKFQLHNEFHNDPRFSVLLRLGENHLTIRHLRISDSATYYCGVAESSAMAYGRGTLLTVKGSAVGKRAIIRQGWTQALWPGNSVNLSCEVQTSELCSGNHSVYWYRPRGSQPALIYANNADLCESRFDRTSAHAGNRTFHLHMADLLAADAGTYYCVVSWCGEILFGNGTAVEIVDSCHPPLVIYILGAALAATVTMTFILTCVYISRNSRHCGCRAGQFTQARRCTVGKETHGPEVHNLRYVDTSVKDSLRRGQRDNVETECIYSTVAVAN